MINFVGWLSFPFINNASREIAGLAVTLMICVGDILNFICEEKFAKKHVNIFRILHPPEIKAKKSLIPDSVHKA